MRPAVTIRRRATDLKNTDRLSRADLFAQAKVGPYAQGGARRRSQFTDAHFSQRDAQKPKSIWSGEGEPVRLVFFPGDRATEAAEDVPSSSVDRAGEGVGIERGIPGNRGARTGLRTLYGPVPWLRSCFHAVSSLSHHPTLPGES